MDAAARVGHATNEIAAGGVPAGLTRRRVRSMRPGAAWPVPLRRRRLPMVPVREAGRTIPRPVSWLLP